MTRHFVGIDDLAAQRHVMVDGAPRANTACTLSHWPGTPTPRACWADLSAEIVLQAIDRGDVVPADVEAVTVDHHDVDALVSLAFLCIEGLADEHRQLLVEAARVGDFGVVHDRRAARIAFALEAILEAPSPPASGSDRVHSALGLLPELASEPGAFEDLWKEQDAAFDAARQALAEGRATIEERAEHDLVVVRLERGGDESRRATWGDGDLHRAALHSATDCLRVATIVGDRFELRYRYESWVRMTSRRPRPRVDLSAAACELTEAEPGGVRWGFDGAGAITPSLQPLGGRPSALSAETFVDVVCRHLEELDRHEPAWDPYR
ncbi:MAG TPA: DUF6687 family protein [Acidimicrobiales bacterium]|nr:DUF6687 family protein [Acidimicrobiales bacterium]